MQFSPSGLDLKSVEKKIKEQPMVDNIHHLHVWQLNDTEIHLEAHIDLKKDLVLSQVCRVISDINQMLKEVFRITHTTLQPEFGVLDPKQLVREKC